VTKPAPFIFDETGEAKRFAPATVRNRDAIADILAGILPAHGTIVEIASGTGEHLVHFAARFPALEWQPSDYDDAGLASISAWSAEASLPNILPPLRIDARVPEWPLASAAAILCINMIHISPWDATLGLFRGAAMILPAGAPLYLYGPYIRADVPMAESNLSFDASLRARDPAWGLRAVEDVAEVAAANGFTLDQLIEMPANNLSLIFRRKTSSS
jgi:hypothetical protein